MASHHENRLLLKPLTQLSVGANHAIKSVRCCSGRLKWNADTKALSIKAAVIAPDSEELQPTSAGVSLIAITEHESARFFLPMGFSVALESGTASPNQPLRFHYRIEATAERLPNETKTA